MTELNSTYSITSSNEPSQPFLASQFAKKYPPQMGFSYAKNEFSEGSFTNLGARTKKVTFFKKVENFIFRDADHP